MKIDRAMARFFFAQHPIVEKLFSKIFAETKNACIFANTKQQHHDTKSNHSGISQINVHRNTKQNAFHANIRNNKIPCLS
jgi:hypothetical protein